MPSLLGSQAPSTGPTRGSDAPLVLLHDSAETSASGKSTPRHGHRIPRSSPWTCADPAGLPPPPAATPRAISPTASPRYSITKRSGGHTCWASRKDEDAWSPCRTRTSHHPHPRHPASRPPQGEHRRRQRRPHRRPTATAQHPHTSHRGPAGRGEHGLDRPLNRSPLHHRVMTCTSRELSRRTRPRAHHRRASLRYRAARRPTPLPPPHCRPPRARRHARRRRHLPPDRGARAVPRPGARDPGAGPAREHGRRRARLRSRRDRPGRRTLGLPKQRLRIGSVVAAFFVAVLPVNISQLLKHPDAFGLDTDRKRTSRRGGGDWRSSRARPWSR